MYVYLQHINVSELLVVILWRVNHCVVQKNIYVLILLQISYIYMN